MSPRFVPVFLFVTVCFLFSTTSLLSGETPDSQPYVTDIIITTSETHLLLFGELHNSFTSEMIDGLHSGIPVKFSFFITLEENVPYWPDREMTSIEFSHILRYDTLKEQYVVKTEETNKKEIIYRNLPEATKNMNEINGLKITKLSNLSPDVTYRLKVKADLYKKTLPMSLHTFIPFVSWWDLNTDWHAVEFTY